MPKELEVGVGKRYRIFLVRVALEVLDRIG